MGRRQKILISTLFTEKLVYDGDRFRTTIVNETAQHIYLKNKELKAKKWDKNLQKSLFPTGGG